MKKYHLLYLVISILLLSISLYANDDRSTARHNAFTELQNKSGAAIQVSWDEQYSLPVMITGQITAETFLANYPSAKDASIAFLQEHHVLFGINEPLNDLIMLSEKKDDLGMHHIKFQQYENGLRVKGQQLWVHFTKEGAIQTINGRWVPSFEASAKPDISEAQASTVARKDTPDSRLVSAELIYFSAANKMILCWEIISATPSKPHIETIIDANNGEILLIDDGIRSDDGRHKSIEANAFKLKAAPAKQQSLRDSEDAGQQVLLQQSISERTDESDIVSGNTTQIDAVAPENEQARENVGQSNTGVKQFRATTDEAKDNVSTTLQQIDPLSSDPEAQHILKAQQENEKAHGQKYDSASNEPEIQRQLSETTVTSDTRQEKMDLSKTRSGKYVAESTEAEIQKELKSLQQIYETTKKELDKKNTDPESFNQLQKSENLQLAGDLEVPSMGLSKNPVKMDESETITATINEVSGSAVSNREIRYYLSTNDIFSTSDILLGTDYVTLAGYGSGTESITFTPQDVSGLTTGSYYVGVVIIDENEVWVLNTQLQIDAAGGGGDTPDLEIPAIGLSRNPVGMSETETLTATVQEVGGAAVSSREIRYYLSTNDIISTSDFYLGNDYVTLSANASGTESISFVPQNISGLSEGTYYVGITIPDESEYWVLNTTLQIGSSATPDLEIPTMSLSQNPVDIDQSETITATVNEVGGAAVSSREIQYYLSTDNSMSTSDYYLGNDFVSLSANGSGTESITFTPENISGLGTGTYYVGIIIPDENEAWILNTTLQIDPSGGTADLEIPTIGLSANPVDMDQTETITATVNEVGGFAVSSREIQYYLSTNDIISTTDFYIGNDYVSLSANGSGSEDISFVPQNISGLTAGTYYVGIRIPDESEYWVLNTTLQIDAAGGGGDTPDLEIPTMSLNPNPVNMDQTETISATVNEVGGAAVTDREIQYYLSTNDIISTSDFYIGNDQVTLAANGSGTESISFTPSTISGLTAGTYYVGIIIPDESEAWRLNTTLQIDPSGGSSDLEIPSIALSLNPVQLNETETITATVNEVGGVAVSNCEIEYYLSTDNSISTSDFYIGNDFVSLAANGSGTESISFIPQDISGLSAGFYYVGIAIPAESEAWVLNTQLQITSTGGLVADLEIPSISLNPNPVGMDETETITASVNEVGGEAVTDREIEYYLSTNDIISTSDFYIGHDYVTLAANGNGTESISFTPSTISGLTAGTYYVGIIIPAENEYWRLNSTLQIGDTPSGGDLEIPSIGLSLNPVDMAETETITATVNEVGGTAVSNREIQYYLSTNSTISTADFLVGTDYVSLAANASGTETTSFIPQDISGLTAGTYYVGIAIPDEGEAWVFQTTLVIEDTGTPDEADLEIPSIGLSLNPVQMTETETFTATVNEVGGYAVTDREIQYYLSTNDIFSTTDFYVGNDYVTLPAYGSGTESISFTPESISGLTAGTYYVGIVIPAENEVWVLQTTLVIGGDADDQSDLEIPSMTLSLNPVDMAETETITADIREIAGYAATDKQIQYYLSVDEQLSTSGDFLIGEDFVDLPANGTGTESITFSPQDIGGLTPGFYYVCVLIPAELEYWRLQTPLEITGETGTNEAIIAQGIDLLGQTRTFGAYRFSGSIYMIDASKAMFSGSISNLTDLDYAGVVKTHTATLNYSNEPGASNLTRDPNNDANFDDNTSLRDAVSAHVNAGTTFDYYQSTYGRNSWDNAGATITSIVHGIPTSDNSLPNNAYWNGSEMVYGDGDFYAGALDIVAHEMTHAVTSSEANLVYRFEPGALNEAYSDVFAALVDDDDWTIGEDLNGGAIRSLANPEAYGCPGHMDDYNDYSLDRDYGGVHTNCGIPSKAAYLMAQEIGRSDMGTIWYRSTTTYLTENSQFLDMRRACLSSASDLYGSNSAQYNAVRNAFDAVGITDGTSGGTHRIAGQVTYYGPNSNPVSNVRLNLTGGDNRSTTTNTSGDYAIDNLDELNYMLTPAKDDQVDNAISAMDAAMILQHTVGSATLDTDQQTAGDVSGNGDLSSYDAALILQYTVGIINNFPAGDFWIFSPERRQYLPLNSDHLSEDFTASIRGDVSRNWSSQSLAKKNAQTSIVLTGDIQSANQLKNNNYKLEASFQLQDKLYAFEGEMVTQGADLDAIYPATQDKNVTFSTSQITHNRIRFALASPEPLEKLILVQEIKPNNGGLENVELMMENVRYNENPVIDFNLNMAANLLSAAPEKFHLYQNFPNPFNCSTTIRFDLVKTGRVKIQVFNMHGQLVTTILDESREAGSHILNWDGNTSAGHELSSGVYVLSVENNDFVQKRKIILMK